MCPTAVVRACIKISLTLSHNIKWTVTVPVPALVIQVFKTNMSNSPSVPELKMQILTPLICGLINSNTNNNRYQLTNFKFQTSRFISDRVPVGFNILSQAGGQEWVQIPVPHLYFNQTFFLTINHEYIFKILWTKPTWPTQSGRTRPNCHWPPGQP